jgi:signal transduction histidine kinase
MVVNLHQGEVLVESVEGAGSTFIVRVPVSGSAPSAQLPTNRNRD